MSTSDSRMIVAALDYAARGWPVFPAPRGQKKSHKAAEHSNGRLWGQTKDPTEIRRDFGKWKDANIGLPTGPDSGFFVVEADTLESHDVDGIASLRDLETEHAPLPATLMAQSPSGSLHHYFKYPHNVTIQNSASKIAPGIDVRGNGGMVIAPPSVKPRVGVYSWLNDLPIADAPAWLIERIMSTAKASDRAKRNDHGYERRDDAAQGVDRDKVIAALKVISSNCLYTVWFEIGAALHHVFGESGFEIFRGWSSTSPQYSLEECRTKWEDLGDVKAYSVGTIFHYADKQSLGWRDQYEDRAADRCYKMDDGGDGNGGRGRGDGDDCRKSKIQVSNGKLSELATAGEDLLIAAGKPLYQRGGTLVHPVTENVDASHGRRTVVAQLKTVDPVYIRDLLCRIAIWERYNARHKEMMRITPPAEIGITILARAGEWRFPSLAGVINTPTMRPDGSLLTKLGYDEETRLLLIGPPKMPDIPDEPTRDDALRAVQLIEDLLTEFPFIDETAKAVALAAIITPIVRGAFLVSPMFLFNAPVAGSGKSFFCDTVSVIAIGQLMPVMAAGRNEEETEKRLGAALIAGQPLINIDNISGDLYGDALCQFIERPIVDVRVLGKSESKRIEARGTTIYGNGNNVVVRGDLCRRVLMAMLDPRMERPELRSFKGNPVATVLADRGLYIAACLTICKAYVVAGRPNLAPKLGSFEGWSDTVRSALMWLGKADPIASMELSRADDPERLDLCNLMTAWLEAFGGVGHSRRRTLATVIATLEGSPDLEAAVSSVTLSKRGQQPDAAALGQYLRKKRNRVIDGRRFETDAKPKGGSAWWIADVAPVKQADHAGQAEIKVDDEHGPDDENEPREAKSNAPRF